jgi:hypothetical protein
MTLRIKSLLTTLLIGALLVAAARGQAPVTGSPVQGVAQYRQTLNGSVKITTGLTYQLVLAALPGTSTVRHSLTIQNNQASGTDVCYLIVGTTQVTAGTTATSTNVTIAGATITAAQASIVLSPGQAYTRYFPYVPADAIYGTCTTSGDSLYVDTQ